MYVLCNTYASLFYYKLNITIRHHTLLIQTFVRMGRLADAWKGKCIDVSYIIYVYLCIASRTLTLGLQQSIDICVIIFTFMHIYIYRYQIS
jgi:hypothetical protein